MNLLTKKLSLVVIAAAVVLSGCTKKPRRPNPSDTALMGPGTGGALNPSEIPLDQGLAPGTDLSARTGEIVDGDKIYGRLDAVYFDFDQAGIKASERPKLEAAQKYLAEHPEQRILLEGHCDWRGTAEYNLGLGDRRAAAARTFIEGLGVAAAKIETLSKGDLDAVENGTEEQTTKDRRVELVVLKK